MHRALQKDSSVTWILPKHYLNDPPIKDAVDHVAQILKKKSFDGPQIQKTEDKVMLTFITPNQPAFKDALYLATLLPLQMETFQKIWFKLAWSGAKDADDGEFECRTKFNLNQYMIKIHFEEEVKIGEELALSKKSWLIRL